MNRSPLAFEVFESNVSETTTLLPMVERCLARYPIRRVVLVADRGPLSLDNVEAMEAIRLSNGETREYILVEQFRFEQVWRCKDYSNRKVPTSAGSQAYDSMWVLAMGVARGFPLP